MKKRYSDEEILLQLKNYYKKNEKITQYGFSKDKTVCEPYAVIIRFGSWEEGGVIRTTIRNYTVA